MSKLYATVFGLFLVVLATVFWMLAYGIILRLVYGDPRMLQVTLARNLLAPFQQILLYPDNRTLQTAAALSLVPAVLISGLLARFALKPVTHPLGDAAFQDMAALRRGHWFRSEGHVFARVGQRLIRRQDDRHHLIIGPTRSGKGVGYVIPNALMFEGSMVVTDLKGEIFDNTAGYRQAKGHRVFLFSPGASKTHRWNPLDFIRTDRGSRTTDIQNVASILIPETMGSDHSVWQGIAQQLIAGVISYVLESPHYHNRRNLGEVNSFFNAGVDLQALMKFIIEMEPGLSRFTTDSFNAYTALNERAARSALLDIQKAMLPFRNERVMAAAHVTDIDLKSMRRRPVSIYLAPNITDVTILRPLLTLFVQQVMDLLTRDHDQTALPVYFLLDEFRQLKKMDEVMNKLPYVASYNIKMAFIIQDLKNLDEIYGETSRHSLIGNCGLQLILGANDQATADYASRALGKKTVRFQSESRTIEFLGVPRRTRSEQIRERDLMMPQEIRQMPEDKLLLLVEGQRPIYASKVKYHTVDPFRSAALFAKDNPSSVPFVEFIPELPVPAVTEQYLAVAIQSAADAPTWVDASGRAQLNPGATNPEPASPDLTDQGLPPEGGPPKIPLPPDPQIAETEAELITTAIHLRRTATSKLADPDLSVATRRSVEDIWKATIPDPVELGLE